MMNYKVTEILSFYKGLSRDIYILFFARVINSTGNFVLPFLTLLLTEKVGLSPKQTGTIMLISMFAFVPGSLLGGKLADMIDRKRIIALCQFCGASFFLVCAFVGASPVLPYLIIPTQFFLGASFPAIQALSIDLTTRETRQAAFSLLYLGHNIGLAIGPSIAGLLFHSYYRLLFIGDALTTFISFSLIIMFVRSCKLGSCGLEDESNGGPKDEQPETGSAWQVLIKRPWLFAFVFFSLILNFVYVQQLFSLPLYMKELFDENGARYYGLVMTTNAVVVIFFTTIAVSLTRKRSAVVNLCFVAILYGVGFGMLFFTHSLYLFFISTAIWSVGEVLSTTNKNVYIAANTPSSHRGRFNAILPVVMSLGFAVGPFLTGWFIDYNSVRMVWPVMAVLSALGLIGFLALYYFEKKRTRSNLAASQG